MPAQSGDSFQPTRNGYENEPAERLTPASFTPVGSPSPAAAEEHTESPDHVSGRHEIAPQEQHAPASVEGHEGHTESPEHVAGRHEVPPHDRYQQPAEDGTTASTPEPEAEAASTGPRKKGWWQRMLPS